MPVKMHTPLLALTLALGLSGSVALADATPDAGTLRAELSRTEKELDEVRAAARQLAVKNQQLEDVASERGRALTVTQAELSAKAAALSDERDALALQLADARSAAASATATIEKLTAERDALADQIAAHVGPSEALTAMQQSRDAAERQVQELRSRLAASEEVQAALRQRLDTAQQSSSAPAIDETSAADLQRLTAQLADTESKLAISLRSYTLLEEQLTQVRVELGSAQAEIETLRDRAAGLEEAQLEAAKSRQAAALATSELAGLREQLRQTQSEAVRLATENSQFRTKLALQSSPPATLMQAPQRPAFRGTAQAAPEAEIVTVTESAPPEASSGPRTHVIGLGDTLGKIAKRYYGSADRWPEIYEANRDVLRDPNRLPVTVTIRIP